MHFAAIAPAANGRRSDLRPAMRGAGASVAVKTKRVKKL